MRIRRAAGTIKDRFVRDERRFHRVRAGLSKGLLLPLNLRHDYGVLWGLNERLVARTIAQTPVEGSPAADVGAGFGTYTFALARMTNARVYAIEGDAGLCDLLRRTALVNRIPNVEVIEGWVGDGADGTITWDDVFAGAPEPMFIKMDIEGAESAALDGATRLLGRSHPDWMIEFHGFDQRRQCLDRLLSLGYSVLELQRPWFSEQRPLPGNGWLRARIRPELAPRPKI